MNTQTGHHEIVPPLQTDSGKTGDASVLDNINESRLESLFRISQYKTESIQELLDFALHEAIALTHSKIGYIFHYDDHEKIFTLNSWSKEVMKECSIPDKIAAFHLDELGLLGEPVRQRKPVIVNDYSRPNPHKKGYPLGHVHISSFLTVPVFVEDSIVAVVGVANKAGDYDQSDVRQLTLLMGAVWSIVERKRTEDELRQSAERLRLHVEQSSLAVIEWDADFRVVRWNPAAERIFGYSAEEAAGQHASFLVAPRAKTAVANVWRSLIEKRDVAIHTNENVTKDGRIIACRWHNTSLTDENGKCIGAVSEAEDVTDRQRLDELKKLADVVRYSSELVNVATLDGNMVFINEAGGAMLGIDPAEVENYSIFDVFSKGGRILVEDEILPALLRGETWSGDLQYRNLKNGKNIDVHATTFSIRDPLTRAPLYLANISLDIGERKRAQQALESEARRFRAIMDASMDGIYMMDAEGYLLECNNAFLRNLGYTREEAKHLHVSDWNAQWSREEVIEIVHSQIRKGKIFETRHRRKDGSILDVEINASTLEENGKMQFYCAVRNITDRKKADAAIRENEQRYRLFVENFSDVIWAIDFSRRFTYVSSSVKDMLGYTPEEFLEVQDRRFHACHPRSHWPADFSKKPWIPCRPAMPLQARNLELEFFRKDGSTLWTEVVLSAWCDETGKAVGFQGIARDITNRKKTENNIIRAKKEWERTFDVIPDIISILDKDHRVLRANKALATKLGLTPRDCVGQLCYRLMHGTDEPPKYCPHSKLLADGRYHAAEVYDDSFGCHYSECVSPLFDSEGNLTGSVHVNRDITKRKYAELELAKYREHLEELVKERTEALEHTKLLVENSNKQLQVALDQANFLAEEAKQASRAKSRFLASMSHELRTPLNGVIGMIDLMCKTSLDERQRRFAEASHGSAISLLQLINDILDFSKIEAERLELDHCEFSLPQVVKNAVQLIPPKTYENLELVCSVAPDCRRTVLGDSNRLQQVLVNLLSNAVKFTAKGEVCLRVSMCEEGPGWIMPKFEITDTGIGIPPDRRNRLFQSFTQIDSSTTRKYGGTGLGLVISKGIVEAMGGQIGVESNEGVGSTFWFTVKLKTAAKESTAQTALPDEIHNLRALVVVANESLQAVVAEYLESWGLHAESAKTATDAMANLRDAAAEPYRLVIIDEQSTAQQNDNLASAIRKDSSIVQPLLIMLTHFEQYNENNKHSLPDNACYVAKPVSQSLLFNALLELCSNSKQSAANPIESPSNEFLSRYAGKARILLAEDNHINQMYCLEILRQAGLESGCVGNGKDAVNAAQTGRYDLVLMDCHMPEMDGYEASWRINRQERENPAQGHIPIIALTANAIKGDREVCLDAGMDDYLSKPFEGKTLIAMIDRLLDVSKGSGKTEQTAAGAAPQPLQPQTECAEVAPAPIDFDVLLSRCMGNAAFAASLLKEMEASGPHQIENLVRHIEDGAAAEAAVSAHSLKGAAGIVGAEPLRALAAEIEAAGKADNLEKAASLLSDIQAEMQRCLECLPEVRKRLAEKK